jgi:predicted ATPase
MAGAGQNFFVITGASGSGKSSIVEELARRGYPCIAEVGRRIVIEQNLIGGDAVPWRNHTKFMELLLSRSVQAYASVPAVDCPVFFDRALPECLGHSRSLSGAARAEALHHIATLRYNSCVFVSPPWPEIYTTDSERKHSFEEGVAGHLAEIAAYADCGYSLLDIPRGSIEERAAFVLGEALSRLD